MQGYWEMLIRFNQLVTRKEPLALDDLFGITLRTIALAKAYRIAATRATG